MYGIDEMDLEQARQHHAERIREASLERALTAAVVNADDAAGMGAGIALTIIGSGVRGWLRWLTTPLHRPASVGVK